MKIRRTDVEISKQDFFVRLQQSPVERMFHGWHGDVIGCQQQAVDDFLRIKMAATDSRSKAEQNKNIGVNVEESKAAPVNRSQASPLCTHARRPRPG
jgi:hypothetical protein